MRARVCEFAWEGRGQVGNLKVDAVWALTALIARPATDGNSGLGNRLMHNG